MGKTKKKKKIGKGKKQHHQERSESLEEDIESEERSYDKLFYIEGLNEAAMQRWWDNFNIGWSRLGQNCCTTVIDGLRVGGSESRLSLGARVYYSRVTLLWTPFRAMTYCSQMRRQ